jgi:hypothetical protein
LPRHVPYGGISTDKSIQGGRRGQVTCAYINITSHEILYEVKRLNDAEPDDEPPSQFLLTKDELAFAPECCIKYSPSEVFDDSDCVYGKVLTCMATSNHAVSTKSRFVYTIMTFVNNKTDEFKFVNNASLTQLKFSGNLQQQTNET